MDLHHRRSVQSKWRESPTMEEEEEEEEEEACTIMKRVTKGSFSEGRKRLKKLSGAAVTPLDLCLTIAKPLPI